MLVFSVARPLFLRYVRLWRECLQLQIPVYRFYCRDRLFDLWKSGKTRPLPFIFIQVVAGHSRKTSLDGATSKQGGKLNF